MPIIKTAKLGDKECILLQFGTGDIQVNNCIEPANSMYFLQDDPKPVENWGLGKDFDYEGEPRFLEDQNGELVYFSFERIESIDVIIEVLQEVKQRMLAHAKMNRLC